MAIKTLKERMNEFRSVSSQKIMPKLPVIINVNGRAFSRVTSNLAKPYSSDFMNAMSATSIKLCHEISGAIFAYSFNDNITVISLNDQSFETVPWFQNDIQKIVSASASIATLEFAKASKSMNLDLKGEPTFTSSVFAVPNVTEAINVLISMQQLSIQSSLSFATYYELFKKYDDAALDIVSGRTTEDKEDLLLSECGIAYNTYPTAFRRGVAYYRAPTLVSSSEGKIMKTKWIVNTDISVFTKDHSFLNNIFKSGSDIFRASI